MTKKFKTVKFTATSKAAPGATLILPEKETSPSLKGFLAYCKARNVNIWSWTPERKEKHYQEYLSGFKK